MQVSPTSTARGDEVSRSAWFALKRDSCWWLIENSTERRMQYDCTMMATNPIPGPAGDKII